MTDLLSAPLKKASDVDLLKPLKNIISGIYSTADKPEDYSGAIIETNKLRGQALSKTLDKSQPALDLLYRYYDQIAALENKIPPHEVNIPFKWKDAFDKGSLFGGRVSLTVPSLSYERVCILYNIAALQSQVGAAGRISDSDEELKTAAKLFQLSSGIFAQLKSAASTMGGQEPTPDLSADVVSALSALMLAQAQEIFVTKAVQDKMKDAIVAKLCVQAEDMYADALRQMQRDAVKHLWDREWLPIVAGKQAAFSALSQYFQSHVCGQKKQVGEQIARLNHCLEVLKQAQTRSGVPNFFADYINKANRMVAEAKKDNDFIYHERVPETSSLMPIDKVASARLAKPTPVPERLSNNFKDLFEEMVPVVVHQAMASCDVRKTEITNSKVAQLREASQLLNSILASLNLPAAIEDSSGGADAVPQSIKEKAVGVQEAGGLNSLMKSVNDLPELVQRNKEILDEAERMLREEEESDNQLRAQLKEKWTRTSSDKLNGTFKTNAARYREILNNALAADEVIRGKLATHQQAIEKLSGGEAGVSDFLPRDTSNKVQGSESAKENLRQLMRQVEHLKSDRESLEESIKNMTFDLRTPFLSALAHDGAINEPAISVELIGKAFSPLEHQVKESLEKQESLVAAIQQNSDEYFGRKPGGDTLSRRDQAMRQLAEGYDAFMDLQNNLKEGTKFYNDLTQLLLAFQNKIGDFCFARKTEKEELLKDVTREASTATSQQAPPPRPPPPSVPQAPASAATAPQYTSAPAPPPGSGPPSYFQTQQPGSMPYPSGYPPAMPMPFQAPGAPYPAYTPMPAAFNPYATYPPPSNYPYPQQPMGYAPPQQQPYYQQPQQPPQQ
ncbi:Programmed cell death 6-interacting protein [Orchesella cincta]|uniref:Programmed cell death 6-interacting protein n=1 Tax=Orchesella cincta TaxID=48709 RepID=A0A1D2N8I2_ORCCI|nr:Programmed cell death 6-interacting protein [Orchesella cincta]